MDVTPGSAAYCRVMTAFLRALAQGLLGAALLVAVLPGNIAQLTEHRDAFRLDTDRARVVRLFFQPVLVLWALWATDAITQWRRGALPGRRSR